MPGTDGSTGQTLATATEHQKPLHGHPWTESAAVITRERSQGKKNRSPSTLNESVCTTPEHVHTRPERGTQNSAALVRGGLPGEGAFRGAGAVLSLGGGFMQVSVCETTSFQH